MYFRGSCTLRFIFFNTVNRANYVMLSDVFINVNNLGHYSKNKGTVEENHKLINIFKIIITNTKYKIVVLCSCANNIIVFCFKSVLVVV